jgi:hypothetical protein
MKLEDYVGGGRIIDGPINESRVDEVFEDIRNGIKYVPYIIYNKKGTKVKSAGIIEALKIAKSNYSFVYKVVSVEYPAVFKKVDVKVDDIFTELKFYTMFDRLESAKKDFDKSVDNELKFEPLTAIELANIWYKDLSDIEKEYVKLLK